MIIGREQELKWLRSSLKKEEPSFFAIYGRRRVGKTFLVNEAFNYKFTFKSAGIAPNKEHPEESSKIAQIRHFVTNLRKYGLEVKNEVNNWEDAFSLLEALVRNSSDKKKVIFLDELAWVDTPKSGFLTALELFWNDWMSSRRDAVLVVCASAASWMVNKVIHNKGGLHNRLTKSIYLPPFTLGECEEYARERGLGLNKRQILDSYMVFGGVPFYWSKFEVGYTPEKNIDNLLFKDKAEPANEFDELYDSLFSNSLDYKTIVDALVKKRKGLTREEILEETGLLANGYLSRKLEDLENCGIIRSYHCFRKTSKGKPYQLLDNFTIFYFQFMEAKPTDEHYFENMARTPLVNNWKGLSFERVVLQHVKQIKEALSISGVSSDICSWSIKGNKKENIKGAQIDLLIARKDDVIDIIEAKHSLLPYKISENEIDEWQLRANYFAETVKTRSAIHLVLVTAIGVDEDSYISGISNVVTLKDLFK